MPEETESKTIRVSENSWRELSQIKLDNKMNDIDAVIVILLDVYEEKSRKQSEKRQSVTP